MPQPLIYLVSLIGFLLLAVVVFWPKIGVLAMWQHRKKAVKRVLIEDVLKSVQHCRFHTGSAKMQTIVDMLKVSADKISDVLDEMSELNLIVREGDEIHLTSKGFDDALRITRAHRLFEEYLAQETGFPLDEIHQRADKFEHLITDKEMEKLSFQLGNPSFDPHGDPIPTASGKIRKIKGQPITNFPINQTLVITHLEDEPVEVYAQLNIEKLHPGMYIHMVEKSQHALRFWSKFGEHVLTPFIAGNIWVVPVSERVIPKEKTGKYLSELKIGEMAEIKNLSRRFKKVERRRLMDLGFIPGTIIEPNLQGAHGDPTAYIIRGSLIALRREQTDLIEIVSLNTEKEDQ